MREVARGFETRQREGAIAVARADQPSLDARSDNDRTTKKSVTSRRAPLAVATHD